MIEYIDIDNVLKQRLPKQYKWLPKWLVRWLERLIHQDELNETLDVIGEKEGVEAAEAIMTHLGITFNVEGEENIPSAGRNLFVSNHPLGGLDGIALIALLGHRYGGEVRFLVNDLLMAVKPLRKVFLPVNKYGRQKRAAVEQMESEFAGTRQMLTFPAGLCSRRLDDGTIGDLPWQKSVVTQAIRHQRDIVPVCFAETNSKRFYRLARWRMRLGIKFNYEMILLPGELFKKRGSTMHVIFGAPVSWESLDGSNAREEASRLREQVYALGGENAKHVKK